MTVKQDTHHVLDGDGEEVFTGDYQAGLRYEVDQDNIELITLPVNDEASVEVYELGNDEYDINFED